MFEAAEKPALKALPATRFAFYHEGQRRVSRDGHIAVAQAYYSVPPEYLGGDVWVRWDSRMLRVFDLKMNLIATHLTAEQGKFSTDQKHIHSRKFNTIENGITYFLDKIQHIGPSSARWAEAVVAERGVEAVRTFQGLFSLCKKYDSQTIDHGVHGIASDHSFGQRVFTVCSRK